MGFQSTFKEFISLRAYGCVAAHLIREANRLCNDFIFGLEPDINLLKIKDNMANRDKGYSFVTDPRKGLN
ncbi:hypothetical protein FOXYSP1_08342 [Fusarium oxysporum f. sp. phaseoli]